MRECTVGAVWNYSMEGEGDCVLAAGGPQAGYLGSPGLSFSICKGNMQIIVSSWWWLEGVLGNPHGLLRLEVLDWGA